MKRCFALLAAALAIALLGWTLWIGRDADEQVARAGAIWATIEAGDESGAATEFDQLLSAAPPSPSPRLAEEQLLLALRLGNRTAARAALDVLLAEAEPAPPGLAAFVAAWFLNDRARRLETTARLSTGRRSEIEPAVQAASQCVRAWRKAARARDDWPAARRNAERAALRLAELQTLLDRSTADDDPAAAPPEPEDASEQRGPEEREETEEPIDPGAEQELKLAPREVASLMDLLDAKEHEKRALRYQGQRRRTAAREKDW